MKKASKFCVLFCALMTIFINGSLCMAAIPGDVNGDNSRNSGDLVELRQILLGISPAVPEADVNGDTLVNIIDLVRLKKLIADSPNSWVSETEQGMDDIFPAK